ncbi:hypothetical protein KKB40_00640 [Patescibacteria group bacterium]|nr:hypothetical protein [Patescibacteria group bacterium]
MSNDYSAIADFLHGKDVVRELRRLRRAQPSTNQKDPPWKGVTIEKDDGGHYGPDVHGEIMPETGLLGSGKKEGW